MERPPTVDHRHPWSGVVRTSSTRRICWWDIRLSDGLRSWYGGHFGTAAGAQAKANRVIRSLEAADRARCERTFEVKP